MNDDELTYYPDSEPGVVRKPAGRGFSYISPDGTRIDRGKERKRLEAMAVPPAYTDVWMTPIENGHLWATGRDARSRKQYRYHPQWRLKRDENKFETLPEFAQHLPKIRRWIVRNLDGEPGAQDTALAVVLALIDRASMRVGSADYTRENKTYGATTLRLRHLDLKSSGAKISYRAKGGRKVKKNLNGPLLNRALHRMSDLPGGDLAVWENDDGDILSIRSEQVNSLISDISEGSGTAKSFRTWNGTLAAFRTIVQSYDAPTIAAASEAAAEALHNTPSIARSGYIHPRILDLIGVDREEREALAMNDQWSSSDKWRSGEVPLIEYLTKQVRVT